jgi:hypothetical protein
MPVYGSGGFTSYSISEIQSQLGAGAMGLGGPQGRKDEGRHFTIGGYGVGDSRDGARAEMKDVRPLSHPPELAA